MLGGSAAAERMVMEKYFTGGKISLSCPTLFLFSTAGSKEVVTV